MFSLLQFFDLFGSFLRGRKTGEEREFCREKQRKKAEENRGKAVQERERAKPRKRRKESAARESEMKA